MQINSKKHGGFGLIEIIISMAVISIISVGVYNAYKILIKQTKQGQVKQTSTLLGNEISEQIKAIAEEPVVMNGTSIDFTKDIQLTTVPNSNNYIGWVHFKEDGSLVVNGADYRYRAKVLLEPKTTDQNEIVSIDEAVINQNTPNDVQNRNLCIIKPKNSNPKIIDKAVDSDTNSDKVDGDKMMKINISKDYKITIESSELGDLSLTNNLINKDKKQEITLDCKYCTGKITIEVNNNTKVPLDLFILNGNNVMVINEKGILHEYRRSEVGGKIGTLYKVTLDIYDDKSDPEFKIHPELNTKTVFQTSFVQNINIK